MGSRPPSVWSIWHGRSSIKGEWRLSVTQTQGKLTKKDEPLAERILASRKDGESERDLISTIIEADEYVFWAEDNQWWIILASEPVCIPRGIEH